MSNGDDEKSNVVKMPAKVGYRSPPVETRFKPGKSGNPSGRRKGSQNLKTLFDKILNEEVSLRDGDKVKKISKAEAILRGVVVGALRGDTRALAMLLRMAEQSGGFEDQGSQITGIQRVIVRWEDLNKASDG